MDTTQFRPYLVIPKLIKQPTWGGTYIVETKQWQKKSEFFGVKIGQSYELYDKSNLSLTSSSEDTSFFGEITDNKSVELQSMVENSVMLSELISDNAIGILGKSIVDMYGAKMPLLLKFTQALGNSFQLHVPAETKNDRWKEKPESWYYFEPGLMTCGIKSDTDWDAYKNDVTQVDENMQTISTQVRTGTLPYDQAKIEIDALLKKYNPWQFVNTVRVEKGTLIDLSSCGIHHSWEEDLATIPLGNVLYEIQMNQMDDVSSIRSFDKGKMGKDGALRAVHIDDYFRYADRSIEANDPKTHMREAKTVQQTSAYTHDRLLKTKYYSLERLTFNKSGEEFISKIDSFRHMFVRSGAIDVTSNGVTIHVTRGHSVFVPAACVEYSVRADNSQTEVLISY